MTNSIKYFILGCIIGLGMVSCSDSVSYAEKLSDENKAVNLYLSNYRVVDKIPADSVFEIGQDAPFYRLDDEGNVFMQVIRPGNKEVNKAVNEQLIYFRFTRYNLTYYYNYNELIPEGNSTDMDYAPTSFRFNNTSLQSSTQYGTGIQMPLKFLGIDCEVNLIVKSQYGFTSEMSSVSPYLYNIRYFVALSN